MDEEYNSSIFKDFQNYNSLLLSTNFSDDIEESIVPEIQFENDIQLVAQEPIQSYYVNNISSPFLNIENQLYFVPPLLNENEECAAQEVKIIENLPTPELVHINHSIVTNEQSGNDTFQSYPNIKKHKYISAKLILSQSTDKHLYHKVKVKESAKVNTFIHKAVINNKWIYKQAFNQLKNIHLEKGIPFSKLEDNFLKYPSVRNLARIFQPKVYITKTTNESLADIFKIDNIAGYIQQLIIYYEDQLKTESKKPIFLNKSSKFFVNEKNKILSKIFYKNSYKTNNHQLNASPLSPSQTYENILEKEALMLTENFKSPLLQPVITLESIKVENELISSPDLKDNPIKIESRAIINLKKRLENLKKLREHNNHKNSLFLEVSPKQQIVDRADTSKYNGDVNLNSIKSESDLDDMAVPDQLFPKYINDIENSPTYIPPHQFSIQVNEHVAKEISTENKHCNNNSTLPINKRGRPSKSLLLKKNNKINLEEMQRIPLNLHNLSNHSDKVKLDNRVTPFNKGKLKRTPLTHASSAKCLLKKKLIKLADTIKQTIPPSPFPSSTPDKSLEISKGIDEKLIKPLDPDLRKSVTDQLSVILCDRVRRVVCPDLIINDTSTNISHSNTTTTTTSTKTISECQLKSYTKSLAVDIERAIKNHASDHVLSSSQHQTTNSSQHPMNPNNSSSYLHAYKAKQRAIIYNLNDPKNKLFSKVLSQEIDPTCLVLLNQTEISKFRSAQFVVSAKKLINIISRARIYRKGWISSSQPPSHNLNSFNIPNKSKHIQTSLNTLQPKLCRPLGNERNVLSTFHDKTEILAPMSPKSPSRDSNYLLPPPIASLSLNLLSTNKSLPSYRTTISATPNVAVSTDPRLKRGRLALASNILDLNPNNTQINEISSPDDNSIKLILYVDNYEISNHPFSLDVIFKPFMPVNYKCLDILEETHSQILLIKASALEPFSLSDAFINELHCCFNDKVDLLFGEIVFSKSDQIITESKLTCEHKFSDFFVNLNPEATIYNKQIFVYPIYPKSNTKNTLPIFIIPMASRQSLPHLFYQHFRNIPRTTNNNREICYLLFINRKISGSFNETSLTKEFSTKELKSLDPTFDLFLPDESSMKDVLLGYIGHLPHGDVDYRFLDTFSPSELKERRQLNSPKNLSKINIASSNKPDQMIYTTQSVNEINPDQLDILSNINIPNFDELLNKVAQSLKTIEEKMSTEEYLN